MRYEKQPASLGVSGEVLEASTKRERLVEMARKAADLARLRPRLPDKTGRRRIVDLTGLDFGDYRALACVGDKRWQCVCLGCRQTFEVLAHSLLKAHQTQCRSCGGKDKRTHGHTTKSLALGKKQTRTYQAWYSMHTRCRCPGSSAFHHYGGKGVRVCDRWASFETFLEDMGEAPDKAWLDRKDGSEDYEPGNCRWLTSAGQRRNQERNCFVICLGVKMVCRDAETLLGFRHGTLVAWVRRNPNFPGDVSQLYFVPWRHRKRLVWDAAGF